MIVQISKNKSETKLKIERIFLVVALTCGAMFVSKESFGQSSVTLYGVVDAGLVYNSNSGGGRQVSLVSGNVQGDRWGVMGTDNLGGGLSAIFKLENGFNVVNGAMSPAGNIFGRQSWVGITDGANTLTLGRQYDSLVDYVQQGSGALYFGTLYAAHPGDYDNMANSWRTNNSIKYRLDTKVGFSAAALFGMGNVAGDFGANRIFSIGGAYDRGPVHIGAAYTDIHDPNFSWYGNNANSSTTMSNMGFSSVISGFASAGTEKLFGSSFTYTWGSSRVGLIYTRARFGALGEHTQIANAFGSGATAILSTIDVNYTYHVTPYLVTGIAYALTSGSSMNGHDGARYHQINIGADYSLSKATDLYIGSVFQHATGFDSRDLPAVANIIGVAASSTPNQVLVVAGMRHKF